MEVLRHFFNYILQMLILVLTLVVKSFTFPINDGPHLFIRIQNPGGTGSFGAAVSKTKVSLEKDGKQSEEPFVPHRPPFLAFREGGPVYAKPPASPQYFPSPQKSKVLPSVTKLASVDKEAS